MDAVQGKLAQEPNELFQFMEKRNTYCSNNATVWNTTCPNKSQSWTQPLRTRLPGGKKEKRHQDVNMVCHNLELIQEKTNINEKSFKHDDQAIRMSI